MTTDNDKPATEPPAGEPLPGFAPDGRFARRLNGGQVPPGVKTDSESPWIWTLSGFSKLRQAYDRRKAAGGDPEALLRAMIQDVRYEAEVSLLAYCLAVEHGLSGLAGELLGRARATFEEAPVQYERILGDLMPAEFREWGRQLHARRTYDSGVNPTADRDWDTFLDVLEAATPDAAGRIETGLAPLDEALLNGLDGLTILGGPTGGGKSTLALNLVTGALRRHPKLAVLYVLLDPGMTRHRLYQRLTCDAADIDYRALVHDRSPEVTRKVRTAGEALRTEVLSRLRIVEVQAARPQSFDEDALVSRRRALVEATGAERVLIVVDDLEHLDVPEELRGAKATLDADFARIEAIQRVRSRTRASEHPAGDPVLLLSGITKAWDGRSPLTADFLPGSVRLKQAADTVLMLQPGEPPADPSAPAPVKLRIVKGRDGARRVDLPLLFDHTRCKFRPAEVRSTGSKGGSKAVRPSAIDPLAGIGED
jgi:replicative DNA helicase